MNLKYKCRFQRDPDAPSVFFCMHPEDAPLFFEELSDLLLEESILSTAWQDTDARAPLTEEGRLKLSQMDYVIPLVTKRFLTDGRSSQLAQLCFARNQGIPILPILLERGAEELFNREVGALHLVPYLSQSEGERERLRRELSHFGEETDEPLLREIRGAFSGRLFLSYRKKDHPLALALMREIHKEPALRDVSIWFDDFLSAGENFNDRIEESLRGADAMLMAVTPSLVGEENYVLSVEYPMARREGKPILPIELVKTDRTRLSSALRDLPPPIPVGDPASLTRAILSALPPSPASREGQARHLYCIGLAYLYGIDLEIDRERAQALIERAADAGEGDAIDHVAERALFSENKTGALAACERALRNAYEAVLQTEGERGACERFFSAIERFPRLSVAAEREPSLRQRSREIFFSCLEGAKRTPPPSRPFFEGLLQLLLSLGREHSLAGDLSLTKEERLCHLLEAEALCLARGNAIEDKADLFRVHEALRLCYDPTLDGDRIAELEERMLPLCRELAAHDERAYSAPLADLLLSESLRRSSEWIDYYLDSGERNEESEALLEEALTLRLSLYRRYGEGADEMLLVAEQLCALYEDAHLFFEAKSLFQRLLSAASERVPEDKESVAVLYGKLASACLRAEEPDEALACLREQTRRMAALYRERPEDYLTGYTEALASLADATLTHALDPERACLHAEEARSLLEDFRREHPDDGMAFLRDHTLTTLADCLLRAYSALGDGERTLSSLTLAIETRRRRMEDPNDLTIRDSYEQVRLADHYAERASLYAERGLSPYTEADAESALSLYEDLIAAAEGTPERTLGLYTEEALRLFAAEAACDLANLFYDLGDLEGAQRGYSRAVSYIPEEDEEGVFAITVGRLDCDISRLYLHAGDREGALSLLSSAEELFRTFRETSPDPEEDARRLARARALVEQTGGRGEKRSLLRKLFRRD